MPFSTPAKLLNYKTIALFGVESYQGMFTKPLVPPIVVDYTLSQLNRVKYSFGGFMISPINPASFLFTINLAKLVGTALFVREQ